MVGRQVQVGEFFAVSDLVRQAVDPVAAAVHVCKFVQLPHEGRDEAHPVVVEPQLLQTAQAAHHFRLKKNYLGNLYNKYKKNNTFINC